MGKKPERYKTINREAKIIHCQFDFELIGSNPLQLSLI